MDICFMEKKILVSSIRLIKSKDRDINEIAIIRRSRSADYNYFVYFVITAARINGLPRRYDRWLNNNDE